MMKDKPTTRNIDLDRLIFPIFIYLDNSAILNILTLYSVRSNLFSA